MSSSFGTIFKISTWGESHGKGVGVVIDGCPAGVLISEEIIQVELDRRRPGQSSIVTPRNEADAVEIISGVLDGYTLGTPIALLVRNKDQQSKAYNEMQHTYRPSHADYCYDEKYGRRAWAGGGRASARETIARVAAGAVAKEVLRHLYPKMDILAWVSSIHTEQCPLCPRSITREAVESNIVRTGDTESAERMIRVIETARDSGDSVGGIINCNIRYAPVGLGDPVFDKLEASLAHAMMSIPACKGFEVGSGFSSTMLRGSEHNDPYFMKSGRVRTRSNNSGGIQGGISNGEDIFMRLAFKPTATVMLEQESVNDQHQDVLIKGKGRHDACVLPRAVPIVESMAALVLCDHVLRQRSAQI